VNIPPIMDPERPPHKGRMRLRPLPAPLGEALPAGLIARMARLGTAERAARAAERKPPRGSAGAGRK